jgi:hypothetical protein
MTANESTSDCNSDRGGLLDGPTHGTRRKEHSRKVTILAATLGRLDVIVQCGHVELYDRSTYSTCHASPLVDALTVQDRRDDRAQLLGRVQGQQSAPIPALDGPAGPQLGLALSAGDADGDQAVSAVEPGRLIRGCQVARTGAIFRTWPTAPVSILMLFSSGCGSSLMIGLAQIPYAEEPRDGPCERGWRTERRVPVARSG